MLNLAGNYDANEALILRAVKLRNTCMSGQAAGLV